MRLIDDSAEGILSFFDWEELGTFEGIDRDVSTAMQFASEGCDKLNLMKMMTRGLRYKKRLKKTRPPISFDYMLDVVNAA